MRNILINGIRFWRLKTMWCREGENTFHSSAGNFSLFGQYSNFTSFRQWWNIPILSYLSLLDVRQNPMNFLPPLALPLSSLASSSVATQPKRRDFRHASLGFLRRAPDPSSLQTLVRRALSLDAEATLAVEHVALGTWQRLSHRAPWGADVEMAAVDRVRKCPVVTAAYERTRPKVLRRHALRSAFVVELASAAFEHSRRLASRWARVEGGARQLEVSDLWVYVMLLSIP